MRIVDLTFPIEDHFRWPIDRRLVKDLNSGDQFRATWIGMPVHAFTHIDSRQHILTDGPTLDETPMAHFVGECAIVDVSDIGSEEKIGQKRLSSRGGHIRKGDIVMLKTCWDKTFSVDQPEYWTRAPWLSDSGARWLLSRDIRAVAFDFPQDYSMRFSLSEEQRPFHEHVSHDILLREGVTLIEYLCNTSVLIGERTFLCALPIKVPRSDGAPARVVAIEDFRPA